MMASDVMVTQVVSVSPNETVRNVARLMIDRRISGIPVVDDAGSIVGIVSEGDLMRRAESGTERRHSWWLDLFATNDSLASEYVREHARRIGDVMTRNVITVTPETDLADVASVLERNRIKRVPVVDKNRMVGIVSRANLLQALAASRGTAADVSRGDAALREAVIARLKAESWTPRFLNVLVVDGKVSMWGVVHSPSEKAAARVAAETLSGVKAVDDNLIVVRESETVD